MKKVIIRVIVMAIASCLISIIGFGQEYIKVTADSTYKEKLVMRKDGFGYVIGIKSNPNYDTIPVLMLVSDTSQWQISAEIKRLNKLIDADTLNCWGYYYNKRSKLEHEQKSQAPYHMKGYKVMKLYKYYYGNVHSGEFYLGSDKKPLNKNIVVWQEISTKTK